ncbi:MAG: hypothetical protein FWC13_06215 [Oscillospiraceae bacterium]|nr:hypothetical protein [Oscillospiraceae bacterium]
MFLFKYELYKVITRKMFWGILVAAVIVNMLTLWWLNPPPEGLSHAQVRYIYDTIRPMSSEDKVTFLADFIHRDEMHNIYDEVTLLENEAYSRLAAYITYQLTINTHSAHLDRIDEAANRLLGTAIFGGDPHSFSARNISRTQQNFYGLRDIPIHFDVNKGLYILLNSVSSDIIIILLILFICIALITDEKDKRLFLIVKATSKGQIHTIAAKLCVMFLCVLSVSMLIFLSGVAFAEVTYGLGDVTRSLQSVPLFIGSTLQLSVAEFLGLHFFAKTVGMFCIGIAVLLIAIHVKHSVILIASTAALAVLNVSLASIPIVSTWNILRFLNMFTLLRPHRVFGDYFNLNIFGYPVNTVPVFILFGAILFIGLGLCVCISFVKKRSLESDLNFIAKITNLRLFPTRINTSWKYFEFKKLAFTNKALIFLIAFIIMQGFFIHSQDEPHLGFHHHSARNILIMLEGPLTDQKSEFILSQRTRYDRLRTNLDRLNNELLTADENVYMIIYQDTWYYQSQINSMQGFLMVYERYEHIRANSHAKFLYDAGYARLFGLRVSDAGLHAGVLLILLLILSLSGMFAMEYKTGMYKILNSTLHGHIDTVRIKLLLSSGFTLIAFIFASLPELLYIGRFFGYRGLNFPLASITPTGMGEFPSFVDNLPIWVYIVFLLSMRLTVFMGISLIILALSLKIRNVAYTVLASAGLLLLPVFLHLFGFELLNPISLVNLITLNPLILAPSIVGAMQVAIFAFVSIMCLRYIIRRFLTFYAT